MPLEMQTTPETPNSIYFPQIVLQTGIRDGVLITSCQIVFSAAVVDSDGKWKDTGVSKPFFVPDLLNLPEDLASLASLVGQIYGNTITLGDRLNSIRKIL